uniref:Uncharacterized protein n=1 Tax=Knipowitschia caucasica TaxID=637954 RepID=A0AAV2MDW5_KNICA
MVTMAARSLVQYRSPPTGDAVPLSFSSSSVRTGLSITLEDHTHSHTAPLCVSRPTHRLHVSTARGTMTAKARKHTGARGAVTPGERDKSPLLSSHSSGRSTSRRGGREGHKGSHANGLSGSKHWLTGPVSARLGSSLVLGEFGASCS